VLYENFYSYSSFIKQPGYNLHMFFHNHSKHAENVTKRQTRRKPSQWSSLRVCNTWHFCIVVPRPSSSLSVTVDRNSCQGISRLSYGLHRVVKSARVEHFSNIKHAYRLLVAIHNTQFSKTHKMILATESRTKLKKLLI